MIVDTSVCVLLFVVEEPVAVPLIPEVVVVEEPIFSDAAVIPLFCRRPIPLEDTLPWKSDSAMKAHRASGRPQRMAGYLSINTHSDRRYVRREQNGIFPNERYRKRKN